jgi:hypothetical protein
MKKAVWYAGIGVVLMFFVLAGCTEAGAATDDGSGDGNGGGDNGSSELTVTGNTQYSGDGGTTVENASFQFTTSGLVASSTGTAIPVTGQLRAGDILFNLDGGYDPDGGEFSITAAGVVVGLRIEVSINGVYDATTGEITGGTTVVSVVNLESGDTQVFRSESVADGESAESSLSDTTGAEESDPIADGDRKFWEGVWVGETRIFFDEAGDPTATETSAWVDLTMRVVATSSQYNIYERAEYNASARTLLGIVAVETYYDTGIIAEIISETSTEIVAVTYYPEDPPGEEYWKERIFLNENGTIWGSSFYNDGGTPDDTDDDVYSYGTITTAKNQLTTEDDIFRPFGTDNGLTKVQ